MHRPHGKAAHHNRSHSITLFVVLLLLIFSRPAFSYSVQTHEQLIDLTWKQSIRPLLLKRFPNLTEAQIKEAHAYAYGGCAIQDLGYYPFGNTFLSDLTHYVRPGDFVLSLIHNARTADELAFAIGALSHYYGDTIGHSLAINESVALEFPKLGKKYGPVVTYEQGEHAHVRTEFAFDVNELSKRHFAPSAYLEHVGLAVPIPMLRRSLFQTYGIDLYQIIGHRRPVLRGYHFAIRSFLPRIAFAEVILHKHSFPAEADTPEFDKFYKDLAQSDFENGWDQYRKNPGIGTHLLAGVIFILPHIGTLSDTAIRGPNDHTQELYVKSFNRSAAVLRHVLANFNYVTSYVPNLGLDTGMKIKPGAYRLTDKTYAKLLATVTHDPTKPVPSGLKRNIADYYSDPAAPISTKKKAEKWAKIQEELALLKTVPTTQEPPSAPDPEAPPIPGDGTVDPPGKN